MEPLQPQHSVASTYESAQGLKEVSKDAVATVIEHPPEKLSTVVSHVITYSDRGMANVNSDVRTHAENAPLETEPGLHRSPPCFF